MKLMLLGLLNMKTEKDLDFPCTKTNKSNFTQCDPTFLHLPVSKGMRLHTQTEHDMQLY